MLPHFPSASTQSNSHPTPPDPSAASPPIEPLALRWLLYLLELVSVLLIVLFIIRLLFVEHYTVAGPSMEPTLENEQEVYLNRLSYQFREPARGDIVVFIPPDQPDRKYVKRIIGLPGERVEIRGDGQVMILNYQYPNGIALDENYLEDVLITSGYAIDKLSEEEYFVMGDNRRQSSDSRGNIGATEDDYFTNWTVPRRNIQGRVFLRSRPTTELTLFKNPEYNL